MIERFPSRPRTSPRSRGRLAGAIAAGVWVAAVAPVDRAHADPSTDDEVIEVEGKAPGREPSERTLSGDEIARLPGFGGDAIKTVQALPGVARPQGDDPGMIAIRGAGRDDARYFVDGIDIPLLFHFRGIRSAYPTAALASLELYPSGYGARYGGAIGGVIELTGRAARRDRWRGAIDLNLLDGSLELEGALGGGWGLIASARRSYAGDLAGLVLSDETLKVINAPYYWDTVVRADRRLAHGGKLFVTAYAAGDRMKLVLPEDRSGTVEVSPALDAIELSLAFGRLIVGWDQPLAGSWLNVARAAVGWDHRDEHVFGDERLTANGPLVQLRDELSKQVGKLTLALGIDAIHRPTEFVRHVGGFPRSTTSVAQSDLGAYGEARWQPIAPLLVVAGVRYDRYPEIATGAPSIRLAGKLATDNHNDLFAAIGTYNQQPQPSAVATDPVYGNPTLPPTTARHLSIGDELRLDHNVAIKSELYFNTQSAIPQATDAGGANFIADARGRMFGVEIMVRREASERLYGWVSYSFSRSRRQYQRRPQESAGAEAVSTPGEQWDRSRWVPALTDQTHHLEVVGSLRWRPTWSTGVRVQYVSGNPITPHRSYHDHMAEFDGDAGDYFPVGGGYLVDRMGAFFRVDARIDKTFRARNLTWTAYLDLQGISYLAYTPPEGYVYNYDYSQRAPIGWIPLALVGLRIARP